jgi:ubiquinone/menaquinone biosynthesis C-methylase UbiE
MVPVSVATLAARPPRPVAWMLLLASAAAVLVTGLAATVVILSQTATAPVPAGHGLWMGLLTACGLTAMTLGLRALRWVFLLRRCETRLPIRDAYIGYLAGFSLLLTPLLLGEIALRAYVLRARGGVEPFTTAVVNLWERFLDAVAIAFLVGVAAAVSADGGRAVLWLLPAAVLTAAGPARRAALGTFTGVVRRLWPQRTAGDFRTVAKLASQRTFSTTLGASLVVWLLTGCTLAVLVGAMGEPAGVGASIALYTESTLAAAVRLAPGGVVVIGARIVDGLVAFGSDPSRAAVLTLALRLSTVGLATALGTVFVIVDRRTRRRSTADHFDELADSYDVQIPEARRLALLDRKTAMMREALDAHGVGPRGLDLGCGQGWYVRRMREMGFEVTGVDSSAGQVARSGRHLSDEGLARLGSALAIPEADASLDFVYTINVLHHLSSVEDQRRAFAEILRVLRPGGLLFLHEINTKNVLFRFYMGYVFPSLNCIDEGVERWLLPDRLHTYTSAPIVETRYFTFLPEFLPASIVRALAPVERLLERSPLGAYSAHYMAVLRKPG